MHIAPQTPLEGKVVLVTGGSRGIGRAIVDEALAQGARVAFCARQMNDSASSDRGGASRVLRFAADVSAAGDVDALVRRTVETFGRLDAVVANAAVSIDDLAVRLNEQAWQEVLSVNLHSAFLLSQRALREFLPRGGGHLVFVGSISDQGAVSQANYAASKGALRGMARALASQFESRGVRCNVVVPGYVPTEMSARLPDVFKERLVEFCPQRRPGTTLEIAQAALFLASCAVGLNGQVLRVSGGLSEVPV